MTPPVGLVALAPELVAALSDALGVDPYVNPGESAAAIRELSPVPRAAPVLVGLGGWAPGFERAPLGGPRAGLSPVGAAAALSRAARVPVRRRARPPVFWPFAARMVPGGVVHWVSRAPSAVYGPTAVCSFGWLAPEDHWLRLDGVEGAGLGVVSCKLCLRALAAQR